jgi:hypothetical protein
MIKKTKFKPINNGQRFMPKFLLLYSNDSIAFLDINTKLTKKIKYATN